MESAFFRLSRNWVRAPWELWFLSTCALSHLQEAARRVLENICTVFDVYIFHFIAFQEFQVLMKTWVLDGTYLLALQSTDFVGQAFVLAKCIKLYVSSSWSMSETISYIEGFLFNFFFSFIA